MSYWNACIDRHLFNNYWLIDWSFDWLIDWLCNINGQCFMYMHDGFKKYYFTHYWCHNLRCSLLDFELNFGRNTQYFNTMRCCTLIYWHNLREPYIKSIKRNTKAIRQYHIIDIHWFSKFLSIFPKLTLVPGYLQNAYSALSLNGHLLCSR